MNPPIDFQCEDFNDSVLLPAQYNGAVARRAPAFEGERRLLWAVLEDAIRTYLVNARRSTPKQRRAFEEVRRWLRGRRAHGLFAFETICDLLGIDSEWLLQGLESIAVNGSLPPHRRTVFATAQLG